MIEMIKNEVDLISGGGCCEVHGLCSNGFYCYPAGSDNISSYEACESFITSGIDWCISKYGEECRDVSRANNCRSTTYTTTIVGIAIGVGGAVCLAVGAALGYAYYRKRKGLQG